MNTTLPEKKEEKTVEAEAPKQSSGKKILVAEDERPLAKAMELKLKNSGFEVTVASNGEEAIEAYGKEKFHMIILDLVMPKMDGFEVLEKLKGLGNSAPIIVISNLSQKEDIDKVKALGASEYFVKSNTPLAEIVDYIRKKIG